MAATSLHQHHHYHLAGYGAAAGAAASRIVNNTHQASQQQPPPLQHQQQRPRSASISLGSRSATATANVTSAFSRPVASAASVMAMVTSAVLTTTTTGHSQSQSQPPRARTPDPSHHHQHHQQRSGVKDYDNGGTVRSTVARLLLRNNAGAAGKTYLQAQQAAVVEAVDMVEGSVRGSNRVGGGDKTPPPPTRSTSTNTPLIRNASDSEGHSGVRTPSPPAARDPRLAAGSALATARMLSHRRSGPATGPVGKPLVLSKTQRDQLRDEDHAQLQLVQPVAIVPPGPAPATLAAAIKQAAVAAVGSPVTSAVATVTPAVSNAPRPIRDAVKILRQCVSPPGPSATEAFERLMLSVEDFLSRIHRRARSSPAIVYLSTYYIWQLSERNENVRITMYNIKRLAFIGIVLAHKFLEDRPARNRSWAKLGVFASLAELNRTEREVLRLLDWQLMVKDEALCAWIRSHVEGFEDSSLRYELKWPAASTTSITSSPPSASVGSSSASSVVMPTGMPVA